MAGSSPHSSPLSSPSARGDGVHREASSAAPVLSMPLEDLSSNRGLSQAEWISDLVLPCEPSRARAAVILIGGFRECGPYHYRHLGALLHDRSLHVSLTSLWGHDEKMRVPAQFSAHNVMNKAVNAVQEAIFGLPETTPLIFGGFSIGALVALQLAQRFSFRPVAGVITEGAYLKGASTLRALYQWNVARKARKLKGPELDEFVLEELSFGPTPVPPQYRTTEWDLRPRIPVIARGAILGIEQLRVDARKLVASGAFTPPVFLAHGVHDRSALPRSSDIIKDSLSSRAIEVCRFGGSAHSIALGPEKDRFNAWACAAVEYFLSQGASSAKPVDQPVEDGNS